MPDPELERADLVHLCMVIIRIELSMSRTESAIRSRLGQEGISLGVARSCGQACKAATAQRRDRFADRGDGLLALFDPADEPLLLSFALPAFSRLLAGCNASLPIRVIAIAGSGSAPSCTAGTFMTTTTDASAKPSIPPSGCSTPSLKEALKMAHGAMLLVVSGDIHDLPFVLLQWHSRPHSSLRCHRSGRRRRPPGLDPRSCRSLV